MAKPTLEASAAAGLPYMIRQPEDPDAPALILLHGLTGDEKVMWVLESALPQDGLAAAPRGLYAAESGYSWVASGAGQEVRLVDFEPAIAVLCVWFAELESERNLDPGRSYLVGFSQGAAFAFSLVARSAIRPAGIIALSGFLPEGDLSALASTPVYWGHGARDEIIRPERARSDVKRLEKTGVDVQYCEAEVGHKVGVECMRGLKGWFETRGVAPEGGLH